jgi:hypothetical protein
MAALKQEPGDLDITIAAWDKLEPVELEFDIDISAFSFVAAITIPASGAVIPMTVDTSQQASRKISVSCDSTTVPVGKQKWSLKWSVALGPNRTIISGDYEVR